MAPYDTMFGLNPDDYGFDDQYGGGAASDSGFLEKAKAALEARRMIEQGIGGDAPPKPISIARIQAKEQTPSLLSEHPEAGKWMDLAQQLAATFTNLRNINRAKKGRKAHLLQVPGGTFNARAKALHDAQQQSEFDAATRNAQIAEQEARINDLATNRWATQRTAQMGQMVPAITKAAMRDPRNPKGPTALEQRLQQFDRFADENRLTPEQRTRAKARILGAGDTRTSQEVAEQTAQAHVRLMEETDKYRKTNPKPGSTLDPSERNRQIAAKYVAELIYNDYTDPEQAAKMGVEMYHQLETNLGSDAKSGAANPPPPKPFEAGVLPSGVPASPAGASMIDQGRAMPTGQLRVKGNLAGLSPDIQSKLQIYARVIALHPERRAQLKADLLKTYGIDPDFYLEPGP